MTERNGLHQSHCARQRHFSYFFVWLSEKLKYRPQMTFFIFHLDKLLIHTATHKYAMDIKLIPIADIRLDGKTQLRVKFNQEQAEEYRKLLAEETKFPNLTVFFDETVYWLVDGFHRLEAHKKLGNDQVACNVLLGSLRDARVFAGSVNSTHGMPRTPEDKRNSVLMFLEDEEWGQWSDRYIAQKAAVGHPFVAKIRNELNLVRSTVQYTTKHGTISHMQVDKINKGPSSLESDSSDKINNGPSSLESDSSENYDEMNSEDITDSVTENTLTNFNATTIPHKPRRATTYRSRQSRQNQIDGLIRSGNWIPRSHDAIPPGFVAIGTRLIPDTRLQHFSVDELNFTDLDDCKQAFTDFIALARTWRS